MDRVPDGLRADDCQLDGSVDPSRWIAGVSRPARGCVIVFRRCGALQEFGGGGAEPVAAPRRALFAHPVYQPNGGAAIQIIAAGQNRRAGKTLAPELVADASIPDACGGRRDHRQPGVKQSIPALDTGIMSSSIRLTPWTLPGPADGLHFDP